MREINSRLSAPDHAPKRRTSTGHAVLSVKQPIVRSHSGSCRSNGHTRVPFVHGGARCVGSAAARLQPDWQTDAPNSYAVPPCRKPKPQALAQSRHQGSQRTQRMIEQGFQVFPRQARQRRRLAPAGDRNDQGRTIDCRRRVEAGSRSIVDHVQEDPPQRTQRDNQEVHVEVGGGQHYQSPAPQSALPERRGTMGDAPLSYPTAAPGRQPVRVDGHRHRRVQQGGDLAPGHGAPPPVRRIAIAGQRAGRSSCSRLELD